MLIIEQSIVGIFLYIIVLLVRFLRKNFNAYNFFAYRYCYSKKMTNFAVQKRKASAPNFTTHSPIFTKSVSSNPCLDYESIN